MPICISKMVEALPRLKLSAVARSVVVDEKPYSMPPRTPDALRVKNDLGRVAPEKPRQTLTASVSLDSLSTAELIAWIVVA